MLQNLSSNQKFLFGALVLITLISISIVIYIGVTRKDCLSLSPRLVDFVSTDPGNSWPWKTSTYYTYSYVDKKTSKEGSQSEPSTAVRSDTETNPTIKVVVNDLYNIKIYRSITDTKPSSFSLLTTSTVNTNGQFTDTNNPSPKPTPPVGPPTPSTAPVLTVWSGDQPGPGPSSGCPSGAHYCNGLCEKGVSECSPGVGMCLIGQPKGGCNSSAFWEDQDHGCTSYCMTPN